MQQIYTVSLSNSGSASIRDIPVIDITVKTGNRAFAPQWSYLWDYKRKVIDSDRYTQLFLRDMKQSQVEQSEAWKELSQLPKVALACYCRPGDFCHRHIVANLLVDYQVKRGYEAFIEGELID